MTPRYALAGYQVDSDMALPSQSPWPAPPTPDLAVAGRVRIREARAPLGPGQARPGRLVLDIPGAACFAVEGGERIDYQRDPQADQSDIAVLLTDTVLPICLQLRGEAMLRAAVVHDGTGAMVLLGACGVGKSVLACALMAQGLRLMCDVYCRVTLDGAGHLLVFSSGLGLRLRADSFALLRPGDHPARRLRSGVDRFALQQPAPLAGQIGMPVRQLHMLEGLDPVRSAAPAPVAPLDILRCLHAYAFREPLVRTPAQRGRYFEAAAALARHAQVLRLRCPWGQASLAGLAQAMAEAFSRRPAESLHP